MTPASQNSIRLFRVLGITVYLHWLWFLVAAIQFDRRSHLYPSPIWSIAEYLALFMLVLLHEFGHALACRQVGGTAREILLWPLGGVAYVRPPFRPGAILWSIAAGPLVNLVLIPVLAIVKMAAISAGWPGTAPASFRLLETISFINIALLIFNMLPIYPLDGGQILRALLWFRLGPSKSLSIASIIGMTGSLLFVLAALWWRDIWLGLIALFALSQCWNGFREAKLLREWEQQRGDQESNR